LAKLNSIILGNNIDVLEKVEDKSVQSIYIDPPFFTQKNHKLYSKEEKKHHQFSDKWNTLKDYLDYIQRLLIICKSKLKNDGTILLHCDKSASHHIRVLLDDVFKPENFINEIIWTYKRWSNSKNGLLNSHQNIYLYSKTKKYKFNKIFTEYSPTTNIDQILQSRERDFNGKSVYQKDKNGEIILGKEKQGVPLSDVWEIPYLNPKATERVGYPTQKPYLLLKQIVELTTDKGDLVLDPCCGSGTTCLTAHLLDRKYIGIDISKEAVELARKRISNPIITNSNLLIKGKKEYIKQDPFKSSFINILNAIPVQRNKGIDGFLKSHYNNKPVAIKIQDFNQNIEEAKKELLKSTQSKKCDLLFLIQTNKLEEINLFHEEITDDRLVILDSTSLIIDQYINGKEKIKTI
jgi:site-specific DNA-methyltransferase (adenine-specific)